MSRPGPANYTANVNRAKTKKWVEAKSYSYDGDDWGEVDDYDEYGGYDEPDPEPVQRTTGLRQRGQSASQPPQEVYGARQDLYQSPVDSGQRFGNAGGPSSQQQQKPQYYGARSFTNPQPQQHPAVVRTNSFDGNDEQQAFSAGGPQRYASNAPAGNHTASLPQKQVFPSYDSQYGPEVRNDLGQNQSAAARPLHAPGGSSIEGPARHGEQAQSPSRGYRELPYVDQVGPPGTSNRTPSMTSNNSALDFHNRRDFSPSAIPPPLQTRGSPLPQSPSVDTSSRPPPRKSSLGPGSPSTVPFSTQTTPMASTHDRVEEGVPGRDRAGSGLGKQLPFVRPADIYRRVQEEKERERQSQESSRPSMDSVTGKLADRPSSGARKDSESSQRLKPTLDPVSERRSEYGMEGLTQSDQRAPSERRSTSKTFDFPKRASNAVSKDSETSTGPMLPDLSRMSGFGESFFGSNATGENAPASMLSFSGLSSQPTQQSSQEAPMKDLQHQPSLGFTSAVHQAFDKAEDQVPPTPSSTQGSTVARSTSGGTSTVSPIISRGPSTATENWNSRLPAIDLVSTPMIPEGPEGGSPRPISSGSQGTPRQFAKEPSYSQPIPLQHTDEQPPPSFIPGYRRNSDTPSPDNSPRRTPILETTRPLRQPQEIELAATTPTEPSLSTSSSSQADDLVLEESLSEKQSAVTFPSRSSKPTPGTQINSKALPESTEARNLPMSPSHDRLRDRTDSSSSGRVRNLADKFESSSRPGSTHSTTPRGSVLGGGAQKKEDVAQPRPLTDRMESFRPHLPGGWESSASVAPAAAFNTTKTKQHEECVKPADDSEPSVARDPPDQQPSTVSQVKDASEEAFAAVAAAGSALAGAFGAAVGMQRDSIQPEPNDEEVSSAEEPQRRYKNRPSGIQDEGPLHPEASRSHVPVSSDDQASTTASTPPPEDALKETMAPKDASRYLPSSMNRDQGSSMTSVEEPRFSKPPPALPLISTDAKPRQYESDRLRKEIVRELTPMSASEPTTAETDYSNYQPTLSTQPSVNHPERESGVLPKEYESYWNNDHSDDEVSDVHGSPGQAVDPTTADRQDIAAAVIPPLQPGQGQDRAPLIPISHEMPSRERSLMLPHRFSWEKPLENSSTGPEPVVDKSVGPKSDFLKASIYPEGHFASQNGPSQNQESSSSLEASQNVTNKSPRAPEKHLPTPENIIAGSKTETLAVNKELPSYPDGLEVALPATEKEPGERPTAEYANTQDQLSQQSPVNHVDHSADLDSPQPEPSAQTNISQPFDVPPPPNAQPKLPAFREILALSSPTDRIRAFNETREQFAGLNTGLENWLLNTFNDLPEHADLLVNSGRPAPNFQSHRPSPSRSKLGSFLPGGAQSSQLNPNNRSHTAAPDSSGPGGRIDGGSSQGFSLSSGLGGKSSSQQVQTKGKDFLHTAGVFGGKANVAAKGLFSKGKSKLRAASGNEKASSRYPLSSESLDRGVQQQMHNIESQASTASPLKPLIISEKAAGQTSLEAQSSSQSSLPRSSEDTPSVESFTQSQLGDDERSESSGKTSKNRPPRISSLYLKNDLVDLKGNQPLQRSVVDEDQSSTSHRGIPSAGQSIAYIKDIYTPPSTTSSNRTPTQANFTDGSPTATLSGKPTLVEKAILQQGTTDDVYKYDSSVHPAQASSPLTKSSPQAPYSPNTYTTNSIDRHDVEVNPSQKHWSGGPKNTIFNVDHGTDRSDNCARIFQFQDRSHAAFDRNLQPDEDFNESTESHVYPNTANAQDSKSQSIFRPVSRNQDSSGVPRPSSDQSRRGPSMESFPDHVDSSRPPSPVSPYQPFTQRIPGLRGEKNSTKYDVDHDSVFESDHVRARSRSRSLSRKRLSENYRRSQAPTIHDHPALMNSSDPPTHIYPGQNSRDEALTPRQQAPEYEIEGVSPPEWPSESRSKSRPSSRSSAFFKSLVTSSSPKVDEPPLPDNFYSQSTMSPITPSSTEDRKSKRASILGSLKGNAIHESRSGQSTGDVTPTTLASQQRRSAKVATPPPPPPPLPLIEDDEFPPRGNSKSAGSRLSKRLQRASTTSNCKASTSAKTEQDGGNKKRFSGIGTLFGRGKSKKQDAPPVDSQNPSKQPSTGETPRDDPSSIPSPSRLLQNDYDLPKPRDPYNPPPPGGYYAPSSSQATNTPPPLNPTLQRNGHSSLRDANTSAYVQDASLRQPIDQRMSAATRTEDLSTPHPPALPPQASYQPSASSTPRDSTSQSRLQDSSTQQLGHVTKKSGSSWTRFSQHGRSKSRQQQPQPSIDPSQRTIPQQPTIYPSLPQSDYTQSFQPSYPTASRSESPPPPLPPPKDEWNRPHPPQPPPAATSAPRTSHHTSSAPQHASPRPPSTPSNRQSLPPLQTEMANKHRSPTVGSNKTLTPEEKRISRQQEIERSTLTPSRTPMNAHGIGKGAPSRKMESEDEPIVMSATSFPGQEWQPEYAHWDGD